MEEPRTLDASHLSSYLTPENSHVHFCFGQVHIEAITEPGVHIELALPSLSALFHCLSFAFLDAGGSKVFTCLLLMAIVPVQKYKSAYIVIKYYLSDVRPLQLPLLRGLFWCVHFSGGYIRSEKLTR